MLENSLDSAEKELKRNEDKPNDFDTFTRGHWD